MFAALLPTLPDLALAMTGCVLFGLLFVVSAVVAKRVKL
jgi:hypothetical protein